MAPVAESVSGGKDSKTTKSKFELESDDGFKKYLKFKTMLRMELAAIRQRIVDDNSEYT